PAEAVIHVDLRVLAFSLVVSLGSGVLFGIVPALHAARADVNDALKDEARTVTAHGRTRNALVVAEVALALMLLVGAGLSLRAFIALARSDNGFVPDQVVTMETDLPAAQYDTAEKVIAFHDELTRRVRALPGVAAATLSTGLPIAGSSETGYRVEGEPPPQPGGGHFTVYYTVDGTYRETMGLRLLAGRFVADNDRTDGPLVVVIDEHMARTIFQGQDPIGKRIRFGIPDRWMQIVGVVGHVNHYGLGETEAAADQVYL